MAEAEADDVPRLQAEDADAGSIQNGLVGIGRSSAVLSIITAEAEVDRQLGGRLEHVGYEDRALHR